MTGGELRIALVMDHPAQQFARALQLSPTNPACGCRSTTGLRQRAATIRASPGRSLGTSTCSEDILGRRPGSGLTAVRRVHWLVRQFRKTRPDVVVCYGWGKPISHVAIMYCLLARTRLLIYGDTTWQHSASGRHRMARFIALNLLLRGCHRSRVNRDIQPRVLYQLRHGPAPHLAGRLPRGYRVVWGGAGRRPQHAQSG